MPATPVTSTKLAGYAGTADPAAVAIDATNGSVITNTGRTLVYVDNTDSVPHLVTFVTPVSEGGLAVADKQVILAAGEAKWFDKFGTDLFGSQLVVAVDAALAPPTAPSLSTAASGGTVAAGTYGAEITYVNDNGETVASAPASVTTTGSTSTITISSPAAVAGATGWYAYVTQAGGSTYTRQQTAGLPTPIGTNLTLTAPPTSGGTTPPTGTALVKVKALEP